MKFFSALFLALLVLPLNAGLSNKLRVLSLDLAGVTPGNELNALFEKVKPDLVCLQGVPNWDQASKVAGFLPGFRVLTCSAFTSPTPGAIARQTAILGPDRAILSWSQEAGRGQGYSLAIVDVADAKLAVLSAQGAGSSTNTLESRLVAEATKLKSFPKNRPGAFLLAINKLANPENLAEAGFETAAPAQTRTQPQSLWVSNAGFLSQPRMLPLDSPGGNALAMIVADIEVGNPTATKFAYQRPLLFPGETAADLQPQASSPATLRVYWLAGAAGLVLLAGGFFFVRRNSRTAALSVIPVPANPVPGNPHLVTDPERQNLLAWLKQHFLQRLISQRQDLIATSHEAARRTLVIEEKLSILQSSIQERIAAYEHRIQRLEDELSAAATENRDLIRSQIELLKEQVTRAKQESSMRRN